MGVITLSKRNFNGGEWSPELWYRSDLAQFTTGNRIMLNFIPTIQGGAANRPGTYYANTTKFPSLPSRLIRFVYSTEQAYILEFGNLYVRFYANNGQVVDNTGTPVEVVTPYSANDVALLKFDQSADVLFLTHPSYPPAQLTRTGASTFSYSVTDFQPTQTPPTGLTAGSSGSTSYAVTAVNTDENESVASNVVTGSQTATLTWTAPSGTQPDHYNVYANTNGMYFFIGMVNGNVLTFTVSAALVSQGDLSLSPPQSIEIFNAANNYPGVCAFYGGRLIYADTNDQPQTLFGSVIGDFGNMNYSSPVQDSDAFTFTINSRQVNEIRWLLATQVCVIGTSGGEWLMQPGNNSTDVTPTSVSIQPQSNWGCNDVPPILLGYTLLFVEASGKVVRALTYSLLLGPTGGYDANDVSEFARHLFTQYPITMWDYQKYPWQAVWAVRQDGTLCGLTYFEQDKVFGWHRHQTQGSFQSVAVIPLPSGDSQTWFIVQRTVNGQQVNYVEYMDNREFTQIQDAHFVDCGLAYSGAPATVFSGLNHLVGETVVALADGGVVSGLVVDVHGTITLPNPASTVHVGLAYTCQLQTNDLNVAMPAGNELMNVKRQVTSVTVGVRNARELYVGPDFSRLVEHSFRTDENYGAPTAMYSGEVENISLEPNSTGRASNVCIQTVNPVPLEVLYLSAQIEYGDR